MITISGIDVQVVRKDIKNLHLAVYPPNGHVRVAVPEHITDDNIRLAVISKLAWIRKQQKVFKAQPRQSERQYISGECHYFLGNRYRLELIISDTKPEIRPLKSGKLKMFVSADATVETKGRILNKWYRAELKKLIPELLCKWQPIVGREATYCGVRKMKTKWGSCNTATARVWLNLELAKKPLECLEYTLVHELVHLHERHHNQRFKSLLEQFLPNWRVSRNALNRAPLVHEDWGRSALAVAETLSGG